MKCVYCKTYEARKKYCSIKCIKRAYILRKYPKVRSFSNNNPDFWKTETGIGFKWEKYAASLLNAEHIPFNNGPDLKKDDYGIDVKVCVRYHRKMKRGKIVKNSTGWWVFNSNNKKKEVKWLFCICLNENQTINKQLYIPADLFYKNKTGITVGENSKFDKYKI